MLNWNANVCETWLRQQMENCSSDSFIEAANLPRVVSSHDTKYCTQIGYRGRVRICEVGGSPSIHSWNNLKMWIFLFKRSLCHLFSVHRLVWNSTQTATLPNNSRVDFVKEAFPSPAWKHMETVPVVNQSDRFYQSVITDFQSFVGLVSRSPVVTVSCRLHPGPWASCRWVCFSPLWRDLLLN